MCPHCRTPETVRHVLLHCPRYDHERTAAGLQHVVHPKEVIRIMLDSQGAWRGVERLAEKIRTDGRKTMTQ